MKYIRTKDGIIAINPKHTNEEIDIVFGKDQKRANTIEELCDEYVVEDDYDFAVYHNLNIAKNTRGTCYGAIWCEWGLKYVAKLNDKGEFELL